MSLDVAGRQVSITNPDKVVFPDLGSTGVTKLDLIEYYLAVAEGALHGVRDRPMILKRFVKGISEKPFFQKRAPDKRPDWIRTARFEYPSGGVADEVVLEDPATLLYIVNLGCVDINPHPVRADDLDHPDELRIDLDPIRGVPFPQVRDVAMVCKAVLDEHGLVGWPKTSGSKGFHIFVRIEPRWEFTDVRHAGLALAREVEKRMPGIATARWWKEERDGVFVDYNQNARDRTTCSAYSVRPTPDARVSAPLHWDEVPTCDHTSFTLRTMPERFARLGDLAAGIDDAAGTIDSLLALYAEQEKAGEGKKRVADKPMLVVGQTVDEKSALAGLERWKARHPDVAAKMWERDFLVDNMRGRSSTWTRIRVNLEHVPEELRPEQEALDPDDPPDWGDWAPPGWRSS